jgi:DNA-binding NtrC family response regulator
MDQKKMLKGKRILIVDDEKDVLDILIELLDMCRIDPASSFEEAKELLETEYYDIAILDIMGVKGFELLKMAKEKNVPALMLTAHSLNEESLEKSVEDGAAYFVPKDEIDKIHVFVADVIEAVENKKNPWVRWFERLGGYFDKKFSGTNWREKEKEYWLEKASRWVG